MMIALLIGFPVLLFFGGAILAFAFAAEPEEPCEEQVVEEARPQAVFFGPAGWTAEEGLLTVEQMVASIESHLREETRATQAFAAQPSAQTLWLDRQALN